MTAIDFTQDQLLEFGDFVTGFTGMDFDGHMWCGLKVSLQERMNACRVAEAKDYLARLKFDSQEKEELVSLLSVPETYFFRDRMQFDALRDKILPEIVEKKSKLIPGKPYPAVLPH